MCILGIILFWLAFYALTMVGDRLISGDWDSPEGFLTAGLLVLMCATLTAGYAWSVGAL